MELNGYGITLKRMEYRDIEMVRMWRNSDFVKQFMEYREHITIEMQKRWFEKLQDENNYYFIIYYDNYPSGLTEIKNISNGVGNLGIFISDKELLESVPMLSYRVIFTILDFAFEELKLDGVEASVLKDNTRAIKFNTSFGFKLMDNQENIENQYYYLSKDSYIDKSKKIKRFLDK